MFFYRRSVPGLAINSYVIGDKSTKKCAVIDPARDIEEILHVAKEAGLTIEHILETHVHADFVSGSRELKARLDGKPTIYCSGMGGKEWIPDYTDHIVNEGDQVVMGSVTLRAVHTPGHTPEHVMWELYENDQLQGIFTGDFLFVGAVGRPDLLGELKVKELSHKLYHSVFDKLLNAPDDAHVFPAHGAQSLCGKDIGSALSSTMRDEKKNNRFLKEKSEASWIADLLKGMPPAPRYFSRMKKVNVDGPSILGSDVPKILGITAEECREMSEGDVVILDVRAKETFAEAHILGSINIPMGSAFSTWAGSMIGEEIPLILIVDHHQRVEEVVVALLRIGFDKIVGVLSGGFGAWEQKGYPTSSVQEKSVEDLYHQMKNQPFVLDIRTDSEWEEGHIEKAHHILATDVLEHLDALPQDVEINVICGRGYRSSIISSFLLREGYAKTINILGGMAAWRNQQLPVNPHFSHYLE